MFLGEFEHSLDDKNRLRLPNKFKREKEEFVILKGNSSCLFVLPKDTFEGFLENANKIPMFSNDQKALRLLFSSASLLEEDNQGRFLLPQSLRIFANIKKDVAFVGVGNRIEIWAKENWQKYKEDFSDYDNLMRGLDNYGI